MREPVISDLQHSDLGFIARDASSVRSTVRLTSRRVTGRELVTRPPGTARDGGSGVVASGSTREGVGAVITTGGARRQSHRARWG